MSPVKLLSFISLSLVSLGAVTLAMPREAPLVAGRPKPAVRPLRVSPPGFVPLSMAAFDTAWFGGTRWDAIDGRWEALRDSVWTFDSGVGSSINGDPGRKPVGLHATMEGWVGADHSLGTRPPGRFRRLSESSFSGSPCVGDATGVLGGDWSFWVGLLGSEVPLCWAGGTGYGRSWSVSIRQTFQATGGAATLSYNYAVECEDGYDFVTVYADTGGGPALLKSYTGSASGADAVALNPGVTLPSGAGSVTLIFRFDSDGSYDDEDGIFPTVCGAFAVDDIVLTGGVVHSANFETGPDGWVETNESPTAGDLSDLEALTDLPAPWVTMPQGCGPADTVLVFNQTSVPGDFHPDFQQNLAWSPWIDLAAEGLASHQGLVLSTEGFFDQSMPPFSSSATAILMYLAVDWAPRDPCDGSQWELLFDITPPRWFCDQAPFIKPLTMCGTPACPGLVPPGATRVRVGVGVQSVCFATWGCYTGTPDLITPWYDNIRVGVLTTSTSDVENLTPVEARPFLEALRPNPFRGGAGVQITFRLPERRPTVIEILDVAGRRVATVFDGLADPGLHEVIWNGVNATGQQAPGGIYFVRLATTEGAQIRKVALIP